MKITRLPFWRCVLALLAVLAAPVDGAAQGLDPAFERTRLTLPLLTDNAAEQADGRLILSSVSLPYYNGQALPKIVRLNLDGTPDLTFGRTWQSAGGAALAIRVLPNQKILLVGTSFSITEGGTGASTRTGVVVLNTDGTLDPNYRFAEAGGAMSADVQPDGKVLIGGDFTVFNGVSAKRLVRLLSTGQVDPGFGTGTVSTGFNGAVRSVKVQPDGKVLVGGDFTFYGTTPAVHLVRLLPDGRLDPTFNAGLNAFDRFQTFVLQPDGKVVFTNGNVTPALENIVQRVLPNGVPDISFDTGQVVLNQPGNVLALQPDGGVLVGGNFNLVNARPSPSLVRLLPTGSMDASSRLGTDYSGSITALCPLSGGSTLVCGSFTAFNNRLTGAFKVLPTGQIDPAFELAVSGKGKIQTSLRLPGGGILVGGAFSAINGVKATNLALLSADGRVDVPYTQALPPLNSDVQALALGPEGKVYVGGAFYENANPLRQCLLRLRADGTQDPGFGDIRLKGAVSTLAVYPDGRLLVGGSFQSSAPNLFRLTAQGYMDRTFAPSFGVVPYTTAAVLQRDERVALLTLSISWQLNARGVVEGASNRVPRYLYALAVQPDGRILVGGEFSVLGEGLRPSVARLLPSGALDLSFNAGAIQMQNNSAAVKALAVQDDGRILCAGYFTSINGQPRRGIARLQSNGQLDNTFVSTLSIQPEATFLSIHPGGRLLVGASAFDGTTGAQLTEGLSCLLVPGLTGPAPAGLAGADTSSPAGGVELGMFPVPATDLVTVQGGSAAAGLRVTVFDVLGRVVWRGASPANELKLSVAAWAAASYTVRVEVAAGTVYRRLLVQH